MLSKTQMLAIDNIGQGNVKAALSQQNQTFCWVTRLMPEPPRDDLAILDAFCRFVYNLDVLLTIWIHDLTSITLGNGSIQGKRKFCDTT